MSPHFHLGRSDDEEDLKQLHCLSKLSVTNHRFYQLAYSRRLMKYFSYIVVGNGALVVRRILQYWVSMPHRINYFKGGIKSE